MTERDAHITCAAALCLAVVGVVDRDKADAQEGKYLLNVIADLDVVAPEAGEISCPFIAIRNKVPFQQQEATKSQKGIPLIMHEESSPCSWTSPARCGQPQLPVYSDTKTSAIPATRSCEIAK